MAARNWQLLYDVTAEGYRDWPYGVLGALGVVGTVGYIFWRKQHALPVTAMSWFLMLFFGVITVFGGALPYFDYTRLAAMLREGQVQKAEGVVSGHFLQEVSYRRSGDRAGYRRYVTYEAFQIGGTTFSYYQQAGALGFRNLGRQKVRLQDGMFLRAWYTTSNMGFADGPRILRLEQVTR